MNDLPQGRIAKITGNQQELFQYQRQCQSMKGDTRIFSLLTLYILKVFQKKKSIFIYSYYFTIV